MYLPLNTSYNDIMNNKKFPVALTFDVDGQTLWTCRDRENFKRPVMLSLGNYGIHEGVPRILRLLKNNNIKASFMVPGMIAELFPETIKNIFLEGHDIGNHGYSHTYPENFKNREEEFDEYKKTNEILQKITGVFPKGFRSPAWEFSENTVDILEEIGIVYSSNMMHTEKIHQLELYGEKRKLVEIPIHWVMDDAAYWLYSTKIIGKSMQPLESVEFVWKSQFDALYEEFLSIEGREDTCYVLTCHPQIIGVPSRLKVLERLINHIKENDKIEFVTLASLAERHKINIV